MLHDLGHVIILSFTLFSLSQFDQPIPTHPLYLHMNMPHISHGGPLLLQPCCIYVSVILVDQSALRLLPNSSLSHLALDNMYK
ncbi:hypothetical protein GALMADRAFT_83178 [Galerina marginata CBS 339.88]|uniref:Uncharacterized protein n=1 Tax=Galerina marginata (strain CBS 339.88) TaxID=685588 RepID=A0A067TYC1_GALM3|nr:hypothetical protein GALMADRAFT_83178 [Galerina marginata CBS 339.88]